MERKGFGMQFVQLICAAVFLASASATAAGAADDSADIYLLQVVVGDKFSAYSGEGPATAPPSKAIVDDKNMVSFVTVEGADGKPYSYVAKDAKPGAEDATLLHVRLQIANQSATDRSFKLLDIGLRTPGAKMVGLGQGPVAFLKDDASMKLVEEEDKPVVVKLGEKKTVSYIFEIPKTSTSWVLTYKGADLAELKGRETRDG
jgi:hypothetical protein